MKAVIWQIAQLRSHGYSVTALMYEEEPIWQMVITELEIWLLCASRRVATGESPIYCLKRQAEHGLAFGMYAVWERRRATATPIDLDAAEQPNWAAVRPLPARLEP